MDKNTIEIFIRQYTRADFYKIRFDWNGKHADDFEDKNYDFRSQVSEYLVNDFNIGNDQLIRDLYIEWSKCSKESWGIYNKYRLFAQQLLERGGSKYLLDYLTGASYSFDTRLASGRITVSDDLRKEIIDCA